MMIIDGVEIEFEGFVPLKGEAKNYVAYVKEKNPQVNNIKVKLCDDGKVDVSYTARGEKFERIRRITG